MTTYYINADTGNDTTGSGTSGAPWKTISKAVSSSIAGDTIQCQDATATYTWSNQTISDRIILGNSSDVSQVVFDGGSVGVVWTLSGTVAIKHITFQAAWKLTDDSKGIFNALNTTTLNIQSCVMKNIKTGSGGSENGGLIAAENNSNGQTITITVSNCVIYDVSYDTVSTRRRLMGFRTTNANCSLTLNLYNNTIDLADATNYFDMLLRPLGWTPLTLVATGNSFINQENRGVTFHLGFSTITYDYNCAYAPGGSWTSVPSGTGNITTDPGFIDLAGNNYNLQVDSVSRAAGPPP